ncbi:DNA translocase FtsK [Candidatus Kaiserbacteria bacterium]|nr:DNA translocase FtsK [Candidatus Kaiserbacteria bacterium]
MAETKGRRGKRRTQRTETPPAEAATSLRSSVSEAALRGAYAIILIALAGFLLIAQAGGGGALGQLLLRFFTWLLGVGYLLLPLSLFLLAVLVLRSFERRFGWVQVSSMSVFLLSSLGLIGLMFDGRGGVLGGGIAGILIALVDVTATAVFLLAFLVASLIIAFDTDLSAALARLAERVRGARTDDAEATATDVATATVTGLPAETPLPPEQKKPEAEEPPTEKREGIISSFLKRDDENGGFPIAATMLGEYTPPPVSILAKNRGKPEVGDIKGNMNVIKRALQNFGITVEMDEASIGPTVTRYAMKPAEGVRLSKIVALQSNLELALAASPVRIEAPIPGKSLVGIEVPNISRTTLGLAPLVTDDQFTGSEKPLLMILGRSITGQPHFMDLAKMPHLLVAGTTGAGKSVTIHNFIVSMLYRCGPDRLRLIMVDPKRVELTLYNSIPHLLTPVITDAKKAILALKWLAKEMDRRYNILEAESVRDIASYHKNVLEPALARADKGDDRPLPEAMPYIVLIMDELADIMQTYPRELESGIVRLAQMSRAVGIHLILSTQRPSVKVITGLIKANIPARVALQVASQIDSRTILDMSGAEKLLGAGDMLFLSSDMSKPVRIQAPYITEEEVKKVAAYLAKQAVGTLESQIDFSGETRGDAGGTDPIFSAMIGDEEDEGDELYPEAKRTVIEAGKASTSYLQRKLGVGYARAAKLMDLLEDRGVIGPADGAKPREIIGAGNADELAREHATENEEF